MPLLAIVYFSISGTTEKLAHAVARSAADMANVALCRIAGDDIVSGRFQNETLLETIDRADAVALAVLPTWADQRPNSKPLLTLQVTDGASSDGPTRSQPDSRRAPARAAINSTR